MIPLGTLLHSLVVLLALARGVLLLLGQPLGEVPQLFLLLVCAVYAVDAAHWCWTMRPRHQQDHAMLKWGDTLPREQAQATVTTEEV